MVKICSTQKGGHVLKSDLRAFSQVESYYTLLGVSAQASQAEIDAAYQRQREQYRPERIAVLGDELRAVAEQRSRELDQAYAVLSDEARRSAYDQRVGAVAARRSGVSTRELMLAGVGVLIGLAIIAAVWFVAGQSAEPELPGVAEVNRPAPQIALPTLAGETVQLSDYRGKVVLVNFWGTWCEPCKEETPALQRLHERLGGEGLVIVGVNLRKQEPDDQAVQAFLDEYGVTYPILLDVAGEAARLFQIAPIPTSFVIDPAGNIRYIRVGTITEDEVGVLFSSLRQDTSALR
jgi:peroxiredoxin